MSRDALSSHDLYPCPALATMDVNFRKIDVDAFDEDVLLESELYDPDPRTPEQAVAEVKAKAAKVRSSLSK